MPTNEYLLAAAALCIVSTNAAAGQETAKPAPPAANPVQTHIEHVMSGWKDTPNAQGLLPTALAEAETAAQHAALAARAPGDLDAMKRHASHVLNALDPSVEPKGPGAGYGVRKASAGVRQHAQLAAKMDGAPDAVSTHSEHVAAAIANVLEWTEDAIAAAQKARAAASAADAAPLVATLVDRTTAIVNGLDANKDGKIGWQKGEGGLAQAKTHMGLMLKKEGQ